MPRSYCKSLIKSVGGVIDNQRMVSADYIVRAMASGDRRHETDRSGINFQVSVQIPWNNPELVVALDTPGVVVLDTSHMPDVTRPYISVRDLGLLRRQWPVSVVARMSHRQTELVMMRHTCKQRFRGAQTGYSSYRGVGFFDGRGIVQCEWLSVGTSLQGIRTVRCRCVPVRNIHDRSPAFHQGLCRRQMDSQTE